MTAAATDVEQQPRRVDVDPQAELEIRFRHPADDGRQVKNRRGVGVDRARQQIGIRDVAGDGDDAAVGEGWWRHDVDEHDPIDRPLTGITVLQRSPLEQLPGQTRPEEPGAAGNDDVHLLKGVSGEGGVMEGFLHVSGPSVFFTGFL